MITRRRFVQSAAALAMGAPFLMKWGRAWAFSQSDNLRKFIQRLRVPGADIPFAQPDPGKVRWWQPNVTHYTIGIRQFEDQLHPDLPNPTRLRGFGQGDAENFRHLGGIIATKRDAPVQITVRNQLPPKHIIPVDTSIPGAELAQNRTSVHLHGGLVPWVSDGGPHAWWDPTGNHGPSFVDVLRPRRAPQDAEYYYPNNQGARLVWYHDHAIGITRINAYAGIASAYVIYDDYEIALGASPYNLPGPLDPRTIYLVFQDKVFVSSKTAALDPTWSQIMPDSRTGDLWYAHLYESELGAGDPPPDPSVVPEFFGDTILVNGTVYPYLEVEPRQYRFRMLNACNARFLNPRLVYARTHDSTEAERRAPGPAFVQIASEGGFLPFPVMLDGTRQSRLLLAPAERADLIVDFRGVRPGSRLILRSNAPAPFPNGDPMNDYYPRNPDFPGRSIPGFGPNTRTLLQIRVKEMTGSANPSISLPRKLKPTDPFLVRQTPGVPTQIPRGVDKKRRLTLSEDFDSFGRLIQFLGTDKPRGGPFGRPYEAEPTEVTHRGNTEVWDVLNLTGDTHPIHFHLVNVQVLSRRKFDDASYSGGPPTYTGPEFAPDANELGWKETVRMNPGEVTRVLMKFDLPSVPFKVPPSPRTGGHEYVWHCHILEHEEHDMMRPLVVKS